MEKPEKDRLLIIAMDEHGHFLTRLAYAFVKDEARAEDIVQEVFLSYYINLENFEGRSSIKTYLYRITVNECHNYFKSWAYRKTEISNLVTNLLDDKNTPEKEMLNKESTKYIAKKINELPSNTRKYYGYIIMQSYQLRK